jgi:precorrin-4/cobalt-precorrin-4 C11-methyltransferase
MGAGIANAGQGKFYIVGMGTAKDLITLRALEVIKSADIVLIETEQERSYWQEYIKDKEVWLRPIALRVMYGADPQTIANPKKRDLAEKGIHARKLLIDRITTAVRGGKIVTDLQGGDPMVYGLTFMLEMLPGDIPTEVVPGVGAFQSASAAVKMSPPFGYDTSAVILTMDDWEGRVDTNETLMAGGSTLVVYTMLLDYPRLFSQLKKHYPADTPVCEVIDAGDRLNQKVIRSTVGKFIDEVDFKNLPEERHVLLIGKFLKVGQARKDFVPRVSSSHAPVP